MYKKIIPEKIIVFIVIVTIVSSIITIFNNKMQAISSIGFALMLIGSGINGIYSKKNNMIWKLSIASGILMIVLTIVAEII
ncbi:hypothetical protein [Clostridium gasigenes]|uniref:DUF3953 domain-containing protein n=1 Tax=Clostridium gasigenes TaxID=94869 RepID=A0A1H0TAR0_9CLOT|nr:hypothetical protein [Clostridium gasigenes]SDP50698.1 hypothetical protein SAMN04488529_106146 [Clostridium gasigenes]